MKYDIIKTDNYLIIADDSEIKEGDFCLADIIASDFYGIVKYNGAFAKHYFKKIIAHLPLNNSPILEGVNLLPQLEDKYLPSFESSFEDDYDYRFSKGFYFGYNKAKEKYKWTDEDVIKIVEKSRETGLTAEYLMLSLFQPKYPITFECEMEEVIIGGFIDGKDEAVTIEKENKPKTTTNSQGQTILVGKYIY